MGWRRPHLALRTRYLIAFASFLLCLLALLYRHHFPSQLQLPEKPLRVIGYSCDHRYGFCGGWADRQKGVVTAYLLAALLGTEFRIHMTVPCDLAFFLAPRGRVDWRLRPGELAGRLVQWIYKVDGDGRKFIRELLSREDPRDVFRAEYVFLTTNIELVYLLRNHRLAGKIPWLQELSVAEVYRHVLNELFEMMTGPKVALEGFKLSLPPTASLVCAQIRVGGGSDPVTFNREEQLQALLSFLAPYNSSAHRLLFTSDSPSMTRRAQAAFPSLTLHIPGSVSHVDRTSGNDVCGSLGRAIVEQVALSTCDVLVVSESGFGKIAAFLRNSDHNLYLFHNGLVQPFRRQDPFPNRLW